MSHKRKSTPNRKQSQKPPINTQEKKYSLLSRLKNAIFCDKALIPEVVFAVAIISRLLPWPFRIAIQINVLICMSMYMRHLAKELFTMISITESISEEVRLNEAVDKAEQDAKT